MGKNTLLIFQKTIDFSLQLAYTKTTDKYFMSAFFLPLANFIIMFPFLLQNPNIKKWQTVWIFTNSRMKALDIFMPY